ncbi:N-acetylmuramoyl-L-alanine amidase [Spirochaetia bacterium]|nr:N-acetylmuramoyl-L-alanine amidase [Spirochaetia bacterium]
MSVMPGERRILTTKSTKYTKEEEKEKIRFKFSFFSSSPFVSFVVILLFLPVFASAQTPVPNSKLYSLDEAIAAMGPSPAFRWDPFFGSGVFTVAGHTAAFTAGDPGGTGLLMVDGREVFTVPAPYLVRGLLFFPEAFVTVAEGALSRYLAEEASRFRIAAIIVDPGHGGKDSGAVGEFTIGGKPFRSVEKDITLKVSKQLHSLLFKGFPDKRVLLTRAGDSFPSLEDRVAIANGVTLKDNEAIIYISIHANASLNRTARGYEVWYLSPEYRREVIDKSKYDDPDDIISIRNAMLEEEFTTESIMMAQSILGRITEAVGRSSPSRGIKAEEWFVVRNARMPSVLVELGFVTNQEDALLMADDGYLQKVSEALYKGIGDFVSTFERSGGFTAIQ